jgi:phosphate transport system substrate-binding protein
MIASRRARRLALVALAVVTVACGGAPEDGNPGGAADGQTVRASGSTTVNPVVSRAAEVLGERGGPRLVVDTQGGSSGGIAALGEGRAEIAMASRPLSDSDRERWPGTDFQPTRIGVDAVALAVAADVWEGGVRSLTRSQVRAIYEGRVTDWSEVGGAPGRIVFYDKEPGRGTWEVFAHWLYDDTSTAPRVDHPTVGSNEEGRTKTSTTPGAITQLSVAWVDGERLYPLALAADGDAEPVDPTPQALTAGTYPLSRPLLVITDGKPAGATAEVIGFLLSTDGQSLVEEAGYLPLDALGEAAPE